MIYRILMGLMIPFFAYANHFVVILDTSGDSGRHIDNTFEQTISASYVQSLSSTLRQRFADRMRIVQLNFHNKKTDHNYQMSAINRLHAHIYLKFTFCKTTSPKPTLTLYRLSYGNEFMQINPNTLFLSDQLAHIPFVKQTEHYAHLIEKISNTMPYQKNITWTGVYALPCIGLVGINCPALLCEFGLPNQDSWQLCLEAIIAGLELALTDYASRKSLI